MPPLLICMGEEGEGGWLRQQHCGRFVASLVGGSSSDPQRFVIGSSAAPRQLLSGSSALSSRTQHPQVGAVLTGPRLRFFLCPPCSARRREPPTGRWEPGHRRGLETLQLTGRLREKGEDPHTLRRSEGQVTRLEDGLKDEEWKAPIVRIRGLLCEGLLCSLTV
ncbi:unnamed protein product [Pleuronectes platessa]|uniref:Uncharacterized protein n=1 Tax=Pleuronectes platessa TaxID=8262 RepID=A0A9N7UV64_PLEPL|nr:unnamed protein product [Pleuronectes platessa]